MNTVNSAIRRTASLLMNVPRVQLLVAMSLVACGIWMANLRHPAVTPEKSVATTSASHRAIGNGDTYTKPIEEVQVGDKVCGDNPLGDRDSTFGNIQASAWRRLLLRAPKVDGQWADVTLLRPVWWLESEGAAVGRTISISVPECGIQGEGEVIAITDCPRIEDGPGEVVTGTFHHSAGSLVDIRLTGTEEIISATGNHPFWSEDQQDFVRADSLRVGEHLRSRSDSVAIAAISQRQWSAPVFNIEVHGSHVYHVGKTGVLVHNGGPCPPILHEMLDTAVHAVATLSQKTLASAPDGKIFVSGAGSFTDDAAKALETSLKGNWSKSSNARIEEIITYFTKNGVPIADHVHDFKLINNGVAKELAGTYNASHAELQAAFEAIVKRTPAERASLLNSSGQMVINIAKKGPRPAPCSSCTTLLQHMARIEGVPIKVNWIDDSGAYRTAWEQILK